MSYQLYCPECRTVIPPENINVQQTLAACPNCAAVFNFADKVSTGEKIKRRKSKKPDNMILTETEHSLKFETPYIQTLNYKVWTIVSALVMSGLYALILVGAISDNDPNKIAPIVLFSLLFLPLILGTIASLFAKQTVEVNHDELKHEVRLGLPFHQRKMPLENVLDVNIEETMVTRQSTAEARYNLYANTYDGREDMFITNLPEDMAVYVQQRLSDYITAETTDDGLSRLQDDVSDTAVLVEEQGVSQVQGV